MRKLSIYWKGSDIMRGQQINRASYIGLVVLSLAALLTVLPSALRVVLSGQMPILEPDEGTGAHIFQLSIVALVPMGFLFLATAEDWTQPWRTLRRLAFPGAAVVLACGILYYFEVYLDLPVADR